MKTFSNFSKVEKRRCEFFMFVELLWASYFFRQNCLNEKGKKASKSEFSMLNTTFAKDKHGKVAYYVRHKENKKSNAG